MNITKKFKIVIIVVLLTTLIFAVSAVRSIFFSQLSFSNLVAIATTTPELSLWTDASATTPLTSIDWGEMPSGSTKNLTEFCIRNDGTTSITLSMNTSNYVPPEAEQYMLLIWNREGWIIPGQQIHRMQFTLEIFSNITGITNFSFDITIYGSGR